MAPIGDIPFNGPQEYDTGLGGGGGGGGALGQTYKYSTCLTYSFQPQAKWPMFQQKTNNGVHEIQHTLA